MTGRKVIQQGVDAALNAIGTLFQPGDVIEIRALHVGRAPDHAGGTYSGYFNFESEHAIRCAVEKLDGHAEGIYVVLNRLNPDVLARSSNRIQARPKHTTSDAEIIERRWLYIDVDAIRPAGISATDEEHDAALLGVTTIRAFLNEMGWPAPIVGDSGNGGHLLYRLPQLELKRAGDLVKQCLRVLSSRFSDELAKVDESTANAARLCKLYGTMTRKGDSTPNRPHRRSALLETPDRIGPVSIEALEALASQNPAAALAKSPTGPTVRALGGFNVEEWLQTSQLEIIKGPEPYKDGRRWTLRNCPFNPQHNKPVVIELANGALAYKCLHQSCSERNWQALRSHVEPGYQEPSKAFPVASVRSESTNDLPTITDLSQIPSVFSLESELEWSVEGMLARGSVTLICAESGTGKTWLGYYLAGCVARGIPVLGRPTSPCRVLYLDGENPLYVVKQRLRDLGMEDAPALTVWGGWIPMPPVGPNHSLVMEFARQHKGLVVFDSLIEFHTGSEQSSTETRAFMRYFRLLANLGATVLILHHTGKAESSKLYRGSSDIKAAIDTAYVLTRASEKPEELGALTMNCFKARLAPGQHFGMHFKKGSGFTPTDVFEPVKTVAEIITEILLATPNRNQSEIVQLAQPKGCSKRQIEECLKTGPWSRESGPKNSTLYSVATAGIDGH